MTNILKNVDKIVNSDGKELVVADAFNAVTTVNSGSGGNKIMTLAVSGTQTSYNFGEDITFNVNSTTVLSGVTIVDMSYSVEGATPISFASSGTGSFTFQENSLVTYESNPNYTEIKDVVITVTDSLGNTESKTLSLTFIPKVPKFVVEYLVVAGGGGGGVGTSYGHGGSGGAGGYLTNSIEIERNTSIQLSVGVGGGGATYTGASYRSGGRGTNSAFYTITAWGGGAGGGHEMEGSGTDRTPTSTPSGNVLDGGSGGGAGGSSSGTTKRGGRGNWPETTPAQGVNGAYGYGYNTGAGNGGGLSASNSITGTSTVYARGGTKYSSHGSPNTGNGGGGDHSKNAGNGGSGIVVVSYPNTLPNIVSIGPSHVLRKADGSFGNAGELVAPLTGRAGYKTYVFTAGSGSISW